MDAATLGVFVTAALGVLALTRAPDPRLTRLDVETQILERLAPDSEAAAAMRNVVDEHTGQLRDDVHLRRDWRGAGVFGGGYFVLAMVGLGTIDRTESVWWQVAGILTLAAALVSMGLALRQADRRPRNRDGSPRD
ncbi:hypothetical protein [Aeromicrobium sp. Leaf272]|uniref:hypothetical protein n=1 Tax=Aeromicrobium sp. Leaf272 TaxID=1736317 RepID=UPI00138F21E3|nr:hypothetical protein [Aeromicrobium sp. Leaf272]